MASANPPPYADKYQWYLDDVPIPGQFGFYYEIFNVTRAYQDRQIKCSVQNVLGKADGVTTVEVQCEWQWSKLSLIVDLVVMYCIPPKNIPLVFE